MAEREVSARALVLRSRGAQLARRALEDLIFDLQDDDDSSSKRVTAAEDAEVFGGGGMMMLELESSVDTGPSLLDQIPGSAVPPGLLRLLAGIYTDRALKAKKREARYAGALKAASVVKALEKQ
ncbi:MAG: hypothetical protein VXY93_17315, partial [Pseudomonadota bacterium]|nr:hypothetical protein [Pseudomonadota bacterium]